MTRLRLGLLILALLALAALAAPLLQGWLEADPFQPDLFARYEPASAAHPWARMSWGATSCCGCSTAPAFRWRWGWRRRWRPARWAPRWACWPPGAAAGWMHC
ncbi:hypothetical protein ACFQU7_02145 [Pseudoroseomonas wenyumeiae]